MLALFHGAPAHGGTSGDLPAGLVEKAQRPGGVAVIVELALGVPFRPAQRLSAAREQAIERRIGHAQEAVLHALRSHPPRAVKRFRFVPGLAMRVDAAALRRLSGLPEVTRISEDASGEQSAGGGAQGGGAVAVRSGRYTGKGQTIAILDSGIDKRHPFFRDARGRSRIVSETCYSSQSDRLLAVCPGPDPTRSTAPGSAACKSRYIHCDHGTAVAGVAAGNGDRATPRQPFSGVARDARLISIMVLSKVRGGNAVVAESDLIRGLERVFELRHRYRIAAANVSLVFYRLHAQTCDDDYPLLKAIVDRLRAAGIATVAATGNDGKTGEVQAPACLSNVVSVGAVNHSVPPVGEIAKESNIAPFVSLLAPSYDVETAAPDGGYTTHGNGTSLAAPFVSGAWAVIKSKHPHASVTETLAVLRQSGSLRGRDGTRIPRLDLEKALR